jgi:hypothetical protein
MRYFLWADAITIGALVAVQPAPTVHPTEVLEAANAIQADIERARQKSHPPD